MKRERCTHCGHEIDPTVCHCGDAIDGTWHDGHSPVPMGCRCHDLDNEDGAERSLVAFREWVRELTAAMEAQRKLLAERGDYFADGVIELGAEIERMRLVVEAAMAARDAELRYARSCMLGERDVGLHTAKVHAKSTYHAAIDAYRKERHE